MRVVKWIGLGVLGVALAGAGALFAARSAHLSKMAVTYQIPDHDFPIPFPLTEAEIAALRAEKAAAAAPVDPAAASVDPAAAPADPAAAPADPAAAAVDPAADPLAGVDLAAVALERAIARGKHLVEARYVCVECHGQDFGGGTMVDAFPVGTLLGPNLTLGEGSVTTNYTAIDWSRTVRHGVNPAGLPIVMPADDFYQMSDRELSDIVAYIRSMPPVNDKIPAPVTGPIIWYMNGFGDMKFAAESLDANFKHLPEPPPEAVSVEFGEHISKTCTGCHRPQLNGGPIAGGDPSWAPARNLTPDESGLKGWTFEQFETALRKGTRPDGSPLKMPMALMLPYMQNVTDTEMRALWAYISQVPPAPTGE